MHELVMHVSELKMHINERNKEKEGGTEGKREEGRERE